ncbi:hypothetical protein N9W89_13655 [Hellea sp.]|nr:hypothetical protein [Hellea sp.]
MKHYLIIAISASMMLCVVPATTAATASEITKSDIRVTKQDFETLFETNWTGTLSYLDYSSKKMSSIPIGLNFKAPKGRTLKYVVTFPNEPKYNSKEKIKLSRDGKKLDGHKVISKSIETDGSLTIITQHKGKDDGQSAMIKMRYNINNNAFTITKDVKPKTADAYFLRNEYKLTR